ncbi:MAG: HD domain-containing protein [bacterium]|nr:HD domain-containing protein [bacterium]
MNNPSAIKEPLLRLLVQIPQVDHPTVGHAYHLANASHEGQHRDAGQPFITHPIGVALLLATELGFARDAEMMAAALLHDAVEDSALTLDDIEPMFGKTICDLVSGVTKVASNVKHNRESRRAATLQHLFTAAHRDPRVLILKLADRVHNMRSIDGISESRRRRRIAQETADVYAPLSHFLGMSRIRRELEDRSLLCLDPRAVHRIDADLQGDPPQHFIDFRDSVYAALATRSIRASVRLFAKSKSSIYRKMERTGLAPRDLIDRFATEVIVSSRDLCYLTLGTLHAKFPPVMDRIKDFIALPKRNSYRALHTHVHHKGKRYEIHIQTPSMHRMGELGVATLRGDTEHEERRMRWLHDLADWHDQVGSSKQLLNELKQLLFTREIVVFTPKGDPIVLPESATVVDFAFAVHSDLGLHCKGGRINGVRAFPFSTLNWGDTVEVATSPVQHPKRHWLRQAKTFRARRTIRRYLKDQADNLSDYPV